MADLILVTGASGFVGKWCVVKLLEKGYRVRGTVRGDAKAAQVRDTVAKVVGPEAAGRLELVNADILNDKGWPEAMQGVTAVMHVATVIRGDEPRDPTVVIRPASGGHRAGPPLRPSSRDQARYPDLVDRKRRLWPRPDQRAARL